MDAGLAVLNAGGDFADGLIAYEGNWRGETFVSFDKMAISLITKQGQQAKVGKRRTVPASNSFDMHHFPETLFFRAASPE